MRSERLQKLIDLDEQVRVALLGNGRETRHDLLALQKAVREEIKQLTQPKVPA